MFCDSEHFGSCVVVIDTLVTYGEPVIVSTTKKRTLEYVPIAHFLEDILLQGVGKKDLTDSLTSNAGRPA